MRQLQLVKGKVEQLVEAIQKVSITCQPEYDLASAYIARIEETINQIDEEFEDDRKAAKNIYDQILAEKREVKAPLESVDKVLRDKMSEYATEQQRIRDEELRVEREKVRIAEEADREKKAAELAAMGSRKEVAPVTETAVERKAEANVAPKVGKTVTVLNVDVEDMSAFLLYAVANGDEAMVKAVRLHMPVVIQEVRLREANTYPGLKITRVQRPSL